mmetsp:Transcript_34389/g.70922  ORF Transcript_34389/g.70922 Transcript_34389/m.70922 type:complete len:242 (+) Transcript_34389:51-776(+)
MASLRSTSGMSTARSTTSSTASNSSKLSDGTQKLLDQMMKDAGINHRKANMLKQAMQETGSLPATPAAQPQQSFSSMSMSSSQYSMKPRPMNPKNSGGKKTASQIALEVEKEGRPAPRPGRPGIDRNKEKQRLATIMQFEGNVPQVQQRELATKTRHYAPPGSNRADEPTDTVTALQRRFGELTTEVEENHKFLQDMKAAGQGGKYSDIVSGTIAEKCREMRDIDRQLEGASAATGGGGAR